MRGSMNFEQYQDGAYQVNTNQYFALLGTVYITPHLNNTTAVILCFLCLGIAVADFIYRHKK